MIVCAAGDIHGALDRLYAEVLDFEASLGVHFEWVLHVGDFGAWPDPSRIDKYRQDKGPVLGARRLVRRSREPCPSARAVKVGPVAADRRRRAGIAAALRGVFRAIRLRQRSRWPAALVRRGRKAKCAAPVGSPLERPPRAVPGTAAARRPAPRRLSHRGGRGSSRSPTDPRCRRRCASPRRRPSRSRCRCRTRASGVAREAHRRPALGRGSVLRASRAYTPAFVTRARSWLFGANRPW